MFHDTKYKILIYMIMEYITSSSGTFMVPAKFCPNFKKTDALRCADAAAFWGPHMWYVKKPYSWWITTILRTNGFKRGTHKLRKNPFESDWNFLGIGTYKIWLKQTNTYRTRAMKWRGLFLPFLLRGGYCSREFYMKLTKKGERNKRGERSTLPRMARLVTTALHSKIEILWAFILGLDLCLRMA